MNKEEKKTAVLTMQKSAGATGRQAIKLIN